MIDPRKARQQQFMDAIQSSGARMAPGPKETMPRQAGMPAMPNQQAPQQGGSRLTMGANFQLGNTTEKLQQQLAQASRNISRAPQNDPRKRVEVNNMRKQAIEAELAKRNGAPGNLGDTLMTPPGSGGNMGGQQPGMGNAPGMNPGGAQQVPNANSAGNPLGMLDGVYNAATNGTISEYNTAANRLRERLDAASEGQMNQARDAQIGRGFGTSGAMDQAQYQIGANTQNAYAQGLNDLSMQFEQQRQQGLQTALGAGRSAVDFASQGMDRSSRERISGNELATQERMQGRQQQFEGGQNELERRLKTTLLGQQQGFEGSQNQLNRDQQMDLAKLGEKNGNWRAIISMLSGIPGLFDGTAGGNKVSSIDLNSLLGINASGSSTSPIKRFV